MRPFPGCAPCFSPWQRLSPAIRQTALQTPRSLGPDPDGEIEHDETTRTVTFDFSNYVQKDGVKPGEASIRFGMEALNGSLSGVLDKVVIDSQHTGVIVDDDGPDDLGLHIGALPQTPRIGDHLAIPFTVTNADEQPAEGLHVSIETTSGLVAERGVIAIPSVPREAKSSTSEVFSPGLGLGEWCDACDLG